MDLAQSFHIPIDPRIESAALWPPPTSLHCEFLRPESHFLRLTLAAEVLEEVAREAEALQTGFLLGRFGRGMDVRLDELHWTEAPPAAVTIRLDPRRLISTREMTTAVESAAQILGRRDVNTENPECLRYWRLLGGYCSRERGVRIMLKMIYPTCCFEMRSLTRKPKLVASPLASDLLKRRPCEYRSGFLTMDQELRLLPLLHSDPLVLTCPLVGVWVAGLNGMDGPFSPSSRLWANCVQYVTHCSIHSRLGTGSSFLLLDFSASVGCWQVMMRGVASWREMTWTTELSGVKKDLEVRLKSAETVKMPLSIDTQSIRGSGISTASSLSQCYEEVEKPACHFSPDLEKLLLDPEN